MHYFAIVCFPLLNLSVNTRFTWDNLPLSVTTCPATIYFCSLDLMCMSAKTDVVTFCLASPVSKEPQYHASLGEACTFPCMKIYRSSNLRVQLTRCSTLLLNELWCINKSSTAYRELMVLPLFWQVLHLFIPKLLQPCAVSQPVLTDKIKIRLS